MSRPDPAGVLLAVAVRLLPAGRREWGTAMRAELAGIEPGPQRLSFALGCVRVIATRPAVWRHVGYPLLMLGVLGGTLRWTAQIGYPPLRAGAAWTLVVLAFPPIPPDIGLAVLATALGMGAAMQAVRRRGEGDTGLLAGVCAGTVATLLIIHAVLLLSSFGPARLIPDLVPAALSPADDLANSRIEIQDPYVWMLLFGWLIALGQCVAALTVPRRTADATDPTLGGRSDLR